MIKALCFFVHADPSQHGKYVAAAKAVGVELTLVHINLGNGSQIYRNHAMMMKSQYLSALNGLFAQAGQFAAKYRLPAVNPVASYDLIGVACFSAGYGLVMELLADDTDARRLDFVCGIDSFYASKAKDGTPVDAQIAPLVRYANRARGCPIACWLGFTDVRTYTYSETGDVAREVWLETQEMAQDAFATAQKTERLAVRQEGGFKIKGHDLTSDDKIEHGWALTRWGPDWLAGCIKQAHLERIEAGIAQNPKRVKIENSFGPGDRGDLVKEWQAIIKTSGIPIKVDGSYGPLTAAATSGFLNGYAFSGRVTPDHVQVGYNILIAKGGINLVALALTYALAGVIRRTPGPLSTQWIIDAFAVCKRNGKGVGLTSDEHPWCAAGFSWLQLEAYKKVGLPNPFLPRVSAIELWTDAVKAGTAIPWAQRDQAKPGDCVIFLPPGVKRGTDALPFQHAPGGWRGHVGRLIELTPDVICTIDCNINDTITTCQRQHGQQVVVGFIR